LSSGAAINDVAIKDSLLSIVFNCLSLDVLSVAVFVSEDSCVDIFVLSEELQEIKIPIKINAVIIRFIFYKFLAASYGSITPLLFVVENLGVLLVKK
ncbi:MAG: hypothetical protein ACI9YE_002369, partial [Psychroserpens sp.]